MRNKFTTAMFALKCVAWGMLACCFPLNAGAQTVADMSTARAQILNGKTGRPVTAAHVKLMRGDGLSLDGKHDVPSQTSDGEGYVPIPSVDAGVTEISLVVDLHRPCSKTEKHTFSLAKVHATGVVSENSCKPRITMYPQAGTLIFYVRDETLIEKMRH